MSEPIIVKKSAAPIVSSESFKVLAVAGLAVVADRTMHSETAIIAVVAAGGIAATWVWGLLHRLRTWNALRFLTGLVSDDVAKTR